MALGRHLICELYNCASLLLDDIGKVEELMIAAVNTSGATLLQSNFHKFTPQGVSGVILIAESHFTVHTWPENKFAAVDIFTCGQIINNDIAIKTLIKGFRATSHKVELINRGENLPQKSMFAQSHKPAI